MVLITEVIKGADDPIEFLGFKGRYFHMLAVFEVSLILFTVLCYIAGMSSLLFFLVMLSIGVGGYFYIQWQMDKYKRYGHIHKQHTPPSAVIQSVQFHQMIKK